MSLLVLGRAGMVVVQQRGLQHRPVLAGALELGQSLGAAPVSICGDRAYHPSVHLRPISVPVTIRSVVVATI